MSKNGMSHDLEKLGKELRKIQPSRRSRAQAMDAAMSAFSDEFLPETAAAKINAAAENNLNMSQGTATETRPTGQTARGHRVQIFGRDAMAKFNQFINFKPQTMMMAGTCAAALIAGLIIVPNLTDLGIEDGAETVAPVEVLAQNDTSVEKTPQLSIEEPQVQDAIQKLASNIVSVERRVIKISGRVEEKAIPAEYGKIKNRVLVRPEKTEWKEVPTTPEELASGGQKYFREVVPALYEIKEETVVLRQAHVQYITIPPVYDIVKETVQINADGSTEVLSSEVVGTEQDEVIRPPEPAPIVKSVEAPIASAPAQISSVDVANAARLNTNTRGKFTVFDGVSNQVVESTETIVNHTGEILCRVMVPAQYKTITKQVVKSPARVLEREIPAVTQDVTVQVKAEDGTTQDVTKTFVIQAAHVEQVSIPAVYETRSEHVLIAPAREEWKPASQAINAQAFD